MTLIVRVVLAFRPRESVTVAVNVILPAEASVPVVNAPFVADHPPPVIVYEVMLLPYAPDAPESVSFALPMPFTYRPVPLVSSASAAESVPADGTTLPGTVSVMLIVFVPNCVPFASKVSQ